MAFINGNEIVFEPRVTLELVPAEELAAKADTADLVELQQDVRDLQGMVLQGGGINVTEVTDTYTERVTAGGLTIVDGVRTFVKKVQGSTTVDENGDLRNAVFSSICSANPDGTAMDEWMPAEDFELGAFDYIDVEKQQIVRQTFSFAVTDMTYGWCGTTPFNNSKNYFVGITFSGLPEVYAGQYSVFDVVCNHYTTASVTSILNNKCVTFGRTAQDVALFSFRDDDLLVFNDDGTINSSATVDAFKAHFAEIGLQIAFKPSEALETDDIVCPKSYIAYNGGTELIEYQGEIVTVTQDYYEIVGGAE